MSSIGKELFMAAHERLIEEYEDAHPGCKDAYERTADLAYDRMRDDLFDAADAARKRQRELSPEERDRLEEESRSDADPGL